MQINKLSTPDKTEPVQALDSYIHDVTDDDEQAQAPGRGRLMMPKDLQATGTSPSPDSQTLKIKLTVPLSFRTRAIEPSSSASRPPRAIANGNQAPKRGRPRKLKATNEADDYAPPRGFKPPKKIVTTTTSAPLSHLNRIQVHHPPPDQPRFPTFVPASVLDSDDLSGSEDSELTDDDETDEDQYPEDTLVIDPQTPHERARVHRELLGNDDNQIPTRAPWKYNRQTNSKRHTPTANTLADEGEDSRSSGNEEDDEKSDDEDDEDDDNEADADHPTPMQIETLSDDEDDKLDSQLFFHSLLAESSGSEDEAQSDRDSVMGDIAVGAAESDTDTDVDVGQFEQPLMVKEGWDGELVFSTEIHPPHGGLLDLGFDDHDHDPALNSQLEDSQTDSLANSLCTLPVTQPAMVSDEEGEEDEEFEDVASEAGETTDDEIMPPSLVSLPFATTISPHATFTPHKQPINLHQLKTTSFPSPTPADVLANSATSHSSANSSKFPTFPLPSPSLPLTQSVSWDLLSSPVHSIATTDDLPPRSRSVSFGSRGGPTLGFFNGAQFGSKRTIIGDTPGKLPSPFSVLTPPAPVFRRKRRANSDLGSFFTKRTKNAGPLASSYFSDDLIAAPQGQLVDLDDLLDASLLSEDIDKPSESDVAQDSALSRWDRIPMGIYRQTRNTPATHEASMAFSFAIGGFGVGVGAPLPRPDFASPARSHVSHGSIDSILWDDEIRNPSDMRKGNHHNPHGHKKRHWDHEIEDLEESLFLFPPPSSRAGPSRGGDRTPTQPRPLLGDRGDMSVEFLSEAKSRKDRRKEKKREKAGLRKQILSALDETLAEGYEEMLTGEDTTP